jgi:hypothetical protein
MLPSSRSALDPTFLMTLATVVLAVIASIMLRCMVV